VAQSHKLSLSTGLANTLGHVVRIDSLAEHRIGVDVGRDAQELLPRGSFLVLPLPLGLDQPAEVHVARTRDSEVFDVCRDNSADLCKRLPAVVESEHRVNDPFVVPGSDPNHAFIVATKEADGVETL